MVLNRHRLLQGALESIAVLFTQFALILSLFLFDPIFQFSILISEFVQQLLVHLQNPSKFPGFSYQFFVQLLADFSLFPLLNDLILQYLSLFLHLTY